MKQMGYQPEKRAERTTLRSSGKKMKGRFLAKSVEIWGLRLKQSEKPEELIGRGIQGSKRPDDRRG